MDLAAALRPEYWPLILVFLFMDLFDTVGTVVGVTQQAGLMKEDGTVPRLREILITDSAASVLGAALGTSTVVTYIESSAGVQEGGRTGLTAIVAGLMFLAALFFEPLARMLGGGFSPGGGGMTLCGHRPRARVRGLHAACNAARIDFSTYPVAAGLPGGRGMPLTYSIADGLAFGFISYPIVKILTGKIREVHPIMLALGAVFVLRYAFL